MKTVKKLFMAVFALAVITTAAFPLKVKAGLGGFATTYSVKNKTWSDGNTFSLSDGQSTDGITINNDTDDSIQFIAGLYDKNDKFIMYVSEGTHISNDDSKTVLNGADYEDLSSILSYYKYTVPATLNMSLSLKNETIESYDFLSLHINITNLPAGSSDSSSSGSEEKVFIDYDTYKSELPSQTVLVRLNKNYGSDYKMDMKAHAPSKATAANQALLADAFAKSYNKTKNILWSWDIFAKRDLTLSENGGRYDITVNTKVTGQAGTVYMECYSPEDKAYTLVGTMDDKGVATFDNFILRPAVSATIFSLK